MTRYSRFRGFRRQVNQQINGSADRQICCRALTLTGPPLRLSVGFRLGRSAQFGRSQVISNVCRVDFGFHLYPADFSDRSDVFGFRLASLAVLAEVEGNLLAVTKERRPLDRSDVAKNVLTAVVRCYEAEAPLKLPGDRPR
jgi:hypothetical protein